MANKDMEKKFIKEIKNELGKNLVSVIKYDYEEYVIITEKLDFSAVKRILGFVQKRTSSKLPLFLKRSGILNSCDVFPMEFINMKIDYEVLYGEDILKNMIFKKKDVARELEFELRTKLITLRQAYLTASSNEEIKELITRAVPTMRPICSGLLFLKNEKIPGSTEQILSADYGVDIGILNRISEGSFKEEEFEGIIRELIEMLEKLIGDVDKII